MPSPSTSTTSQRSKTPRVRPVPAVSRALAILRFLAQQTEPSTLKTISQELEMVTSTCLHILRALVEEQMVQVDASTKRYTLGVGVLSLARSVAENNPFHTLAQPVLDKIAEDWNVTTIGVKVAGIEDLVVLALARSRSPFSFYVEVGSRFPALTSATGRLVAAHSALSDADLLKQFKQLRWDNAPEFAQWQKEVNAASRQGFSIDQGNYMSGITVIAVPVLTTQARMTHALVAVGVTGQLTKGITQALAKALLEESRTLSLTLGGRP
ncbi:IclR family transcriptional regulator [Pseudorhodoferax soli]|uniref:IclR family transcriptional regulator n=1 Tax=Pseudorhodoferax soli TaxID=545864 RepID=A0A368X6J4_9BURK|nr:IclR family transcriptional regulator [Pseudorhodoferax soli]